MISDPGVGLDRPIVDTGENIKSIASADTMEEAVELANRDILTLQPIRQSKT